MKPLNLNLKSLFLLLFLLSLVRTTSAQSNLYLNLSQSTKTYSLADISKISFDNSSIIFSLVNNTADSYLMTNVNTISFTQETATPQLYSNNTFKVYPNPAKDMLYISSDAEVSEKNIYIYQLNAILLIQCKISGSNQGVDISSLAPGFYIIKVNNQCSKFSVL